MRALQDTWTMAKRSLRHTVRSMDTIITVAATPIAMMLLFVYVFGGLGSSLGNGSVKYVDFIVPGIVAMCVVSGIAYAAVRVNMDLQKGIINRFKTMPVAPSSILGGHAVSSVASNLFSVLLVILVALIVGFRPSAGIVEWLLFGGLLTLFTAATTWLAIMFGLLAKTVEGAGSFSYLLLLLVFVSPAFTPTDGMNPVVRSFAEHQPMTPIVETMRSLLTNGTIGDSAWSAAAWCIGLLVVSYFLALRIYKRKTS
ncbi:MAG TPA: ABC transporter permease [Candidatus Saccharimonadales bacterium]|nr:ABC transporter permease [Candidatus Saccharimonadales bacterium]